MGWSSTGNVSTSSINISRTFPSSAPCTGGYATSEDLIHWEEQEVAIFPDEELGWAFSGSAVEAHGLAADAVCGVSDGTCLVAALTHHDPDSMNEVQSLSFSTDQGASWQMFAGNPVLQNPGIADFRDPKVFWHAESERWAMVLAAGDRALFYTSENLVDWTEASVFGPVDGFAGVWECPELLWLPIEGEQGGAWVLQIDINHGFDNPEPAAFYWVGAFDGAEFQARDGDPRLVNHGSDFYATQAWNGLDDRAVWIAWQANWAYALGTPSGTWRGHMTTPRELGLRRVDDELVLWQRPIPELETLWLGEETRSISVGRHELSNGHGRDIELALGSGDGLVFSDGEAALRVGVDAELQTLSVSRAQAGNVGFSSVFQTEFSAEFPPSVQDRVDLRILIDTSSFELFAANGEVTLSLLHFDNTIYTDLTYESPDPDATTTAHRTHPRHDLASGATIQEIARPRLRSP